MHASFAGEFLFFCLHSELQLVSVSARYCFSVFFSNDNFVGPSLELFIWEESLFPPVSRDYGLLLCSCRY